MKNISIHVAIAVVSLVLVVDSAFLMTAADWEIRVLANYLTLGWTPTEGEVDLRNSQGESEAELRRRAADILPMGRMCERNDYMEALVYMMSDASAMMTGSTLRVTAGEYI